ncbi:MAG TPA: CocE/NonD family hydrolase [Candidatus Limnocylindrales bacterium]|nr:CocE/NonD family hydrolase [Candidatus Limnocylindrales bacterium]
MRIVADFPREIREVENLWIPLADGERMAARVFLPTDAETDPVPAIVEYNPYRKRDLTAVNNEPFHRYLAGQGFAGVRLEIRGSGESDGILGDEYLLQELSDGVEAIDWLARQPWCSGRVGMIGNSWAGFNALQIAALRPPALGAIVTSCSTDDRYADDMHYMGGCLLTDMLDWGTMFQGLLALPPDPALVGDRWREMWQRRMAEVSLPLESWLRHPRRDDFWRHGSVCEDFSAIEVPVLAVGGWLDGYSNAISRLLAGLSVPRRAVIGPWAHAYPHLAVPGPGYDFLAEVVRWFDHWLKGADTGAMDGPMLRAWMAEALPARPYYEAAPGRWVGEEEWPSRRIEGRRWFLGDGRLAEDASATASRAWASPRVTGLAGGEWCPYGTGGRGPEFPGDQREDDGRSMTWDSPALDERLEILGAPAVTLELSVDRPSAFVAVRLCDVAPDGPATRVTYGVLNLTHRESHAEPRPMVAGQRTRVRVQLNDVAYAFLPGHRLRLALSTDYWPMVWPSPEPVTVTVYPQASTLELPVRPLRSEDAALPDLGEPTWGPPATVTELRAGRWGRELRTDAMSGETSVTNTVEGPLSRLDRTGRAIALTGFDRSSIRDHPTSARTESRREFEIIGNGVTIRVSAEVDLSCTRDNFNLAVRMAAREDGTFVWARDWAVIIPRDHV